MLLQDTNYGFEGELPAEQIESTIEQSAHLFDVLSNSIYKDKVLAVVREPVSNAYDAHVIAKKLHVPFKIKVPTRLDPTFSVEDEGTGIDPTLFKSIYFTYGKSTKTKNNDTIGALGLGCKSPLAYTKSSFVVKNRFGSVEYIYLVFLNKNGIPAHSLVSQETTALPNGMTVEFAVRTEDVSAFHDRINRFFKYWEKKPIVVGDQTDFFADKRVNKVISGTNWFLETRDRYDGGHQGAIAIQGNVPYPIDVSAIPNISESLKLIAQNPFVIDFDMGTLGFTASRESLSYDDFTNKNLTERLEEVRAELQKSFETRVLKKGQTTIEFRLNFARVFEETIKALHTTHNLGTDQNEWSAQLLLNKGLDDTVKFGGYSYVIKDLIGRNIRLTAPEYLPFQVCKLESRGKRTARLYVNPITTLELKVRADVPGSVFYAKYYNPKFPTRAASLMADLVKKDTTWREPWRSARVGSRQKFGHTWDCAVANLDLCTAETKIFFKTHDIPTVIINDVGSSGYARFKLLENQTDLLVDFNVRETDADAVEARVTQLFADSGMSGCSIKRLSDLPDRRPPAQKVKTDRDLVKLKFMTITRHSKDTERVEVRNGLTYTIPSVHVDRSIGEDVFNMNDLRKTPVLYVVKRRTEKAYYDDVNATCSTRIMHDDTIPLASAFGFFDDHCDVGQKVNVFVLTAGKLDWLKKRQVTLVAIGPMIGQKIRALETAEGFVQTARRIHTLEEIDFINLIRSISTRHNFTKLGIDVATKSATSTLWKLYAEYETIRKASKASAEAFAKIQLLSVFDSVALSDDAEVTKIDKLLEKKYPMLELLGNTYIDTAAKMKVIFNYIDDQDN